jgi:hypothetical protein
MSTPTKERVQVHNMSNVGAVQTTNTLQEARGCVARRGSGVVSVVVTGWVAVTGQIKNTRLHCMCVVVLCRGSVPSFFLTPAAGQLPCPW